MGQGGEVTFIFDTKIKGTQTLQMVYNRGPVNNIKDAKSKTVIVNIQEKSEACTALHD